VEWIRDARWLGEDLSRRLQAVLKNRVPQQQFFVALAPNVGNPVFRNEPSYAATKFSRRRFSDPRDIPLLEHGRILGSIPQSHR
jgi:hypothetical protein